MPPMETVLFTSSRWVTMYSAKSGVWITLALTGFLPSRVTSPFSIMGRNTLMMS